MKTIQFPATGRSLSLVVLIAFGSALAAAQSTASSRALPDDPGATLFMTASSQSSASAPAVQPPPLAPQPGSHDPSLAGRQTKRILGIVPNFRTVSADEKLPPASVKDKFKESSEDALDYSDFIFVGMLAGVGQAEDSYPEFHQGAAGYGRYYWHTLADQVDEDYQVEFIFPVALHQDSRYYTLGHGGFAKRAAYAFSRVLITRTDHGNETFNASEIVGAGTAAGISCLYYPSPERTWTKTGQRWVVSVGLDAVTFVFQEFWPNINNKFFHQKN